MEVITQQYEEGGQDPEAEKQAADNLDACKDRLIAGWDPRVLGSPAVAGDQTHSTEPTMQEVQLFTGK